MKMITLTHLPYMPYLDSCDVFVPLVKNGHKVQHVPDISEVESNFTAALNDIKGDNFKKVLSTVWTGVFVLMMKNKVCI